MQRLNLSSMLDKFQARTPSVLAQVNDFEMVNDSLARVVVSFNSIEGQDSNALAMAVAAAFGNDASPVENSFRAINSMGAPALYGFVRANTEVRTYDETASTKGMQAIASNMFIDQADNSLWEVKSAPDGSKMLARQTGDNLSELMTTARVHRHGQPVLASVGQDVAVRSYVAFVDPAMACVRYGYALASDGNTVTVLPNDAGMDANQSDNQRGGENTIGDRVAQEIEPVTIDTAMVIETAYLTEADKERFEGAAIEMPADSRSNAAMQAYYKQLYAYDPSYYAEIQKQINEHASL